MKIIVLSIILFLGGCATVGKFESKMEAKKGLTKEELVNDMGIPEKEYKSDNFEILEYYQSDVMRLPQSSMSTVAGNTTYSTTGVTTIPIYCKLEFKIIKGIVSSYRYKGSMCRST